MSTRPGVYERSLPLGVDSIVPFGKYKGKLYRVLIADVDYCHYLIRGSWLNGAARELLEEYYTMPECRGGMMYACEGIYVTCVHCSGRGCLTGEPDLWWVE